MSISVKSKEIERTRELLKKAGFDGNAVFTIEYDLPTKKEEKGKKYSEAGSVERAFRNALMFALHFKIGATRHLESTWLIDESRLEIAEAELQKIKDKFVAKGFYDIEKCVWIHPIFCEQEDLDRYVDRKIEFLLQFIEDQNNVIGRGLNERRLPYHLLWRAKKAVEMINEISEDDDVKGHKRYMEVKDTLVILEDNINRFEQIKKEEKKANGKDSD